MHADCAQLVLRSSERLPVNAHQHSKLALLRLHGMHRQPTQNMMALAAAQHHDTACAVQQCKTMENLATGTGNSVNYRIHRAT